VNRQIIFIVSAAATGPLLQIDSVGPS